MSDETTQMDGGYWWCSKCQQRVDPRQVTHDERHETCGGGVVWLEIKTTSDATGKVLVDADELERLREYWQNSIGGQATTSEGE